MIPDLNCTQARGKWYVYHRHIEMRVLAGFVGSRDELNAKLATMAPEIEAKVQAANDRFKLKTDGWRMDAAKLLHKVTSRRASWRKLPYELSVQTIYDLLREANDQCAVSGIEMVYLPKEGDETWHRRPLSPSIDRIDNGQGYTPSNIRIVCACVNIGINEWGLELFQQVCRAVTEKQSLDVLQK